MERPNPAPGARVLGKATVCRCAKLPVCLHTYGMTSVIRDFGGRDHGFEAHGLGRALSEDGAVRKAAASRACCHKGSRVVRQKLRLSVLSELKSLLSRLGESFPAKQEAVLESWPAGRHWCPGTSTSPAHSVRRQEAPLRNPVFKPVDFGNLV